MSNEGEKTAKVWLGLTNGLQPQHNDNQTVWKSGKRVLFPNHPDAGKSMAQIMREQRQRQGIKDSTPAENQQNYEAEKARLLGLLSKNPALHTAAMANVSKMEAELAAISHKADDNKLVHDLVEQGNRSAVVIYLEGLAIINGLKPR